MTYIIRNRVNNIVITVWGQKVTRHGNHCIMCANIQLLYSLPKTHFVHQLYVNKKF